MDPGIRVASPCIRASLAAALALALSACTYPKFLGEEPTDGESTTEEAGTASASSQGSAASTGVVTGGETSSTGAVTGDDSATGATTCVTDCPGGSPGGAPGCLSESNEKYWCECMAGDSLWCGLGSVSVCLAQDAVVFTHTRWSPCGNCEPGQQRACEGNGGPGRQFCSLHDVWIDDIENPPKPKWGTCLLEQDIACEPGESRPCEDGISAEQCDVDPFGMPFWTGC